MSDFRIKKLLMIDDNQADHFLTRHLVEGTGLVEEFISFLSAEEALDYLGQSDINIDLILLDINMPVMDGFEFLEQAQARFGDDFNYPVVVMLTTSLDQRDIDRANQFSVVKDYCHKPLDEDDLQKYAQMIQQ